METIDLRVDSDSENELKEQVESEETAKRSEMETADAVASISGEKPEEPALDEDFSNVDDLANTEIPVDNTASVALITNVKQEKNDEYDADTEEGTNITGPDIAEPKDISKSISADVEMDIESVDAALQHITPLETHSNSEGDPKPVEENGAQPIILVEDDVEPPAFTEFNQTNDNKVLIKDTEPTIKVENCADQETPQEALMPQITSIFGNVHIEPTSLANLSNIINKKISTDASETEVTANELHSNVVPNAQKEIYSCDDDVDMEEDIIKTVDLPMVEKPTNEAASTNEDALSLEIDKSHGSPIKSDVIKQESELSVFGEVTADITFDDDGIEFLDDGIVIDDEDENVEMKGT